MERVAAAGVNPAVGCANLRMEEGLMARPSQVDEFGGGAKRCANRIETFSEGEKMMRQEIKRWVGGTSRFRALAGWTLVAVAVIADALGGEAVAAPNVSGRPDGLARVSNTTDEDYARQLEQLKTELTDALPPMTPQSQARYLEALKLRANAEANLKAAQARCEAVAKAKGLVDHARGKWIGGADKGIADAKAKLAQAQTSG